MTASDPATTPVVLRGHETLISSVAISSDSHWLATSSKDLKKDVTARLWDLTTSDPAANPVVLRGHEEPITTAVISPDNHWLVTSGPGVNATARLWDLTTPDPASIPIVLPRNKGPKPIAISPDSHWLVTVNGEDYTGRLWTLRLNELIELACRTAGRNFSYSEWERYFPGKKYQLTCPDLPVHFNVLEKGRELTKGGDVEGALAIFRKIAELDPSSGIDPQAEVEKWRTQ